MIIEALDESAKDAPQFMWKFQENEQEYRAVFEGCDSPFCGCSEITFSIRTDQRAESVASVKFDVVTEEATIVDSGSGENELARRLVSELSAQDKEVLSRVFHSNKVACERDLRADEVEPPPFPIEEIETKSLMVSYREVFPWSEDHPFSIGGQAYLAADLYCLNSGCNCTNVHLDFLGFDKGIHFNEHDPTLVAYEYQTGKWNVLERGKAAHSPTSLMKELLRTYPNFGSVISERRATMKLLYRRYMESVGADMAYSESGPPARTVGRNAPCPCGSGKKYKKCCGKAA
jgi:SEC-C motif domain protein